MGRVVLWVLPVLLAALVMICTHYLVREPALEPVGKG
jgi:hypothetical protein